MSNLIVIARVIAKEGHAEEVKAALLELIEPTLKEEGCIQYDCHQDLENPHKFCFYEIWESAEHLKVHGASAHILAMRAKTEGLFAERELSMMKKL